MSDRRTDFIEQVACRVAGDKTFKESALAGTGVHKYIIQTVLYELEAELHCDGDFIEGFKRVMRVLVSCNKDKDVILKASPNSGFYLKKIEKFIEDVNMGDITE